MAVGIVTVISSRKYMIWDGGYAPAEFQITFKDVSGKPVEGIELHVQDLEGHNYFHYPVTDYLPGQIPSSDKNGLIVFHHVSEAIEFSCGCDYVFFVIPIEERRGPAFLCRFLHKGKEVYRSGFSELDSWEGTWEQVPKVKRSWQWSTWPTSQLLMNPNEDCDAWHARAVAFFDLNRNGKLDPEEAAAFGAATNARAMERAFAHLGGVDKEAELEFPIVQRMITVQLSGP
jgi:hypothetical protein